MRRRPVVISALAVILSLAGTGPSAVAQTDSGPAPSLAPVPLADRLQARIGVPGSPDWPTAAFGSIWVLAPDLPLRDDTATPNLVRIDPATNAVSATIALPDRLCQGMVAGADRIWVCATDALVSIDPVAGTIAETVPVTGTSAFYRMAEGGGRIWALGTGSFVSDTVIRLDPDSLEVSTFPAGGTIGGMTYAFDALWLAQPVAGTVLRMDPVTGETRTLIGGLPTPTQVVAGDGSLWVTLHGGDEDQALPGQAQVLRLDPETGAVQAELAVGGSPRGGVDIIVGEDAAWVRSTRPWLSRVDLATSQVTEVMSAEPDVSAIQGPLTEAFGSLWTVNIEEDAVYRVDAGTVR